MKTLATKTLRALRRDPFSLPKRVADYFTENEKRRQCTIASNSRLFRTSRIQNGRKDPSTIKIGSSTLIYGSLLTLPHGGQISIGDFTFISEGTRIWSAKNIKIGDRVLISHDVNIHDTISHSLSARHRHDHFRGIVERGHPKVLDDVREASVCIEDDVWIGFNAVIMPGVTVGRGAVVGACAVVTKDVAPFDVVVGNPAHIVRRALE